MLWERCFCSFLFFLENVPSPSLGLSCDMALSNDQSHVTGRLLWCETWVWRPDKLVRIIFKPSFEAQLLLCLCESSVNMEPGFYFFGLQFTLTVNIRALPWHNWNKSFCPVMKTAQRNAIKNWMRQPGLKIPQNQMGLGRLGLTLAWRDADIWPCGVYCTRM